MKQRLLSILLVGAMTAGLLAGCGDNDSKDKKTADNTRKEETDKAGEKDNASAADDELVEIVWQWPGSAREGLQEVEDALNEMLEKDIGVHVTLYPCVDWDTQLALDVAADVQVDLCLSLSTAKVGEKADDNLILPLDDIIEEYGAEIIADNGNNFMAGYYDGKVYAMPTAWKTCETYGIYLDKAMCNKYGYYFEDSVEAGTGGHTLEEIEEIFAAVKAGEGDAYYCFAPWPNDTVFYKCVFEYDPLAGGSVASGVLMLNESFENTTIENLFETETFEEYARKMYEWQQKGYISKDAATIDSHSDFMQSGTCLACFYWSKNYDQILDASSSYLGTEVYRLNLTPSYKASPSTIGWSVPVTSVNPQKAVETLNYIYEHDEAAWLLQYGIEGRDYEVIEEQEVEGNRQLKIKYLADDPNALPYYQMYGVYGDRFGWPAVGEATDIMTNRIAQAEDEAVPDSRISCAPGYVFNSNSVSNEIMAINAVINEYVTSINCGVKDPDVLLPEFREALKNAGIDKVIEENQRQFDEWLQNK